MAFGTDVEREGMMVDLAKMSPDRLLTMFAAICAIGFGALALVLYVTGVAFPGAGLSGYSSLGGAIVSFAIALVFGVGLLFAYAMSAARPTEGAILALAFSIVLLVFGGMPGVVAGIVGLVGALTGIVRNLRFTT